MSESLEYPITFNEFEAADDAVGALKNALLQIQAPLQWESTDGRFFYSARPVDQEYDDVDFASLNHMPWGYIGDYFNAWSLLKVSLPDINDDTEMEEYLIIADEVMTITRHTVGLMDDSASIFAAYAKEREMQEILQMTEVTLEDYADLDNALHDLKPIGQKAFEDRLEAMRHLTDAERQHERQLSYSWLKTPDMDKLEGPRWWGITEGMTLHAVKASSPDEAAVLLEEQRGYRLNPIFWCDPIPDEFQAEMNETYSERAYVRLIPCSTVAWPEDFENLSSEQKAALDDAYGSVLDEDSREDS